MLKVNVRRLVEKIYGENRDRKAYDMFTTVDGFVGNECFQVRQGFDTKIDKYIKDAESMNVKVEKYMKNTEEYTITDIKEKVKLTQLICNNKEGKEYIVYLNSHYYRYMKKQGLEIKVNPKQFSIAGFKDRVPQVLCFAVRTSSDFDFEDLETIEEYKARTEEQKQQKERMKAIEKEKDIKYANILIKKYVENHTYIFGKEIKMDKDNVGYCLRYKDEEFGWLEFENLWCYERTLNAQKRLGKIIMEMIATVDVDKTKEEIAKEKVEKKRLEEEREKDCEYLLELQSEIESQITEMKDKVEIGVYGDFERGCRLEVMIKNVFTRVTKDKETYIFEDVMRTLNGEKNRTEGSREDMINFIMDKVTPVVDRLKKEKRYIDVLNTYLTIREVIVKTKDGRTQVVGFAQVYNVERGKRRYTSYYEKSAGEYILRNVESIAFFTEGESLTQQHINKKEFISVDRFVEMKENAINMLPDLRMLSCGTCATLLRELGNKNDTITYDETDEFLEKLIQFCFNGVDTHYKCWQDIYNAYKETLELEKIEKEKVEEEKQRVRNMEGSKKQVAWAKDIMKDVSIYLDEIQKIADTTGETEQIENILEQDEFFSVRDALNTIRNMRDTSCIIQTFKSFDVESALYRLEEKINPQGIEDGEFKDKLIKNGKESAVCEVLKVAVEIKRKENKKMKFTEQWFKVGDTAHMRENKRGSGMILKNRMPVKIVGVHKYGKIYHYDIEVTNPRTKEIKVLREWVTQDHLIPPDTWEEMKRLKIVE